MAGAVATPQEWRKAWLPKAWQSPATRLGQVDKGFGPCVGLVVLKRIHPISVMSEKAVGPTMHIYGPWSIYNSDLYII